MLVHDLRGPLGNLISAIELTSLLIENEAEISKITHFLEMGRRSGQAISDMVDSMLDVSRLEQGEMPLQRTPTDLYELLQAVEDQVTHRAIAKQMELKIHEPPAEVNGIWLDSSMIRRVLVNLVGNAIKYTPDRGHVSLTTSISKGSQLHFAVSDDGPGISKSDQAHIFQKFSRIDHTSSTPGVGLGLAFCKLATEAHRGTISVDSEGIPDQGTTFHVYLPIVEEATP